MSQVMSDGEDPELEILRQAALSSLLKKTATGYCGPSNTVFYRPLSNSNLISIQPVKEELLQDPDGIRSDDDSSGSEYAIIDEGLSVSSDGVDQVIEEIIVSDEEDGNGGEIDEGEDAISIASHDSFDEVLNTVEAEIRGTKKRTLSLSKPRDNDSKRSRSDRSLEDTQQKTKRSSPINQSFEKTESKKQPPSASPNSSRTRRSNSPRNKSRKYSPDRWNSKSPILNAKRPINGSRRSSTSPMRSSNDKRSIGNERNNTSLRGLHRRGDARERARPRDGDSDSFKDDVKHRPFSGRSLDRRKSRSRSPQERSRNKLSFGDSRLRTHNLNSKSNSRNSSRRGSRERSRSPKNGNSSASPRQSSTRSPSPAVDLSKLSEVERQRFEKRKLKFDPNKVSKHSGKIILKPKDKPTGMKKSITLDQDESIIRKDQPRPITSRLGGVIQAFDVQPSRSNSGLAETNDDDETPDNNNAQSTRNSPSKNKTIGKDDLRTKLQQKRAANVGRLFSTALKETLRTECSSSGVSSSSKLNVSVSPRR